MNELKYRLRKVGGIGDDAADFIEQQAEDIAALQAKLSAMEKQEPVAWMMCAADKETRLILNRPSEEHHKLFTCIYPLYTAPKVIPLTTPKGYALISIDALKAWGKYDEVVEACRYPIGGQQP